MPNNKMERFTQRARRVLTLAQEEAEKIHSGSIDTGHMLLGLLREEGGIAGRVLRDLGLEQPRVEALIAEWTPSADHPKNQTLELSSGCKRVLELTVDEARRLGHHYIGTEHLLLGLVRADDSTAVRILKQLDITPEQVRRQTRLALQKSPVETTPKSQRQSSAPAEDTEMPSARPTVHIGTGSLRSVQSIVMRTLEMVSEEKLTIEQASELLRVLQLDLTLTPSGKAKFASMVNLSGEEMKRRVRVKVYDSETKQPQFEIVNSVDQMLRYIDHFLQLVGDNEFDSVTFESDSGSMVTEISIEKDEDS